MVLALQVGKQAREVGACRKVHSWEQAKTPQKQTPAAPRAGSWEVLSHGVGCLGTLGAEVGISKALHRHR